MKGIYYSGVAHNAPTSYLKPLTAYLIPLTAYLIPLTAYLFCFFPFSAFAQTQEATVTNVEFSCPGTVTVTYNLKTCDPVDVTLYYSSENCGWSPAVTEENVQPGTGKTITWDAAADNVSFGKFYYKVEYPGTPSLADDPEPVLINGVKWAPVNLDVDGWFCENPWDIGGYYQWGRLADGHERPTSATIPTLSPTDNPGHSYFILAPSSPYDWRSPKNDALWNSGTEFCSIDPCPEHWRVPTATELETLGISPTGLNQTYVTKVWTTQNGINGFLCTDNSNKNSLFLPVSGYRDYSGGSFYKVSTDAGYWSSTPIGTQAYVLYFYSGNFNMYGNSRAGGFPIRCILE